ncbi:PREDICTED: protein canopy homolog 2 [Polistes canadensis]|uniref:protein canopy homolog 2 n=1 Tax=Polistes canadensis TaxID=91411 RepID=UPI000718D121|nr:PREDICTED: protein canopy homolog 2 [Polistes canadensis]
MKNILIIAVTLQLCIFVKSIEIDTQYLKCLVCRATVNELKTELAKTDPSVKIEVGSYRMDADGNTIRRKVSKARSELHILDTMDEICDKMSDYVRATYRTNGQLTIFNIMDSSDKMNSEMSKVHLVQDGDLNKSLKYYCEAIVQEFEDSILSLFSKGEIGIRRKLCTDIAEICDPDDFVNEDKDEDNVDDDDDDDDDYEEYNKIDINDEL